MFCKSIHRMGFKDIKGSITYLQDKNQKRKILHVSLPNLILWVYKLVSK